jgi:hypothetical protein
MVMEGSREILLLIRVKAVMEWLFLDRREVRM